MRQHSPGQSPVTALLSQLKNHDFMLVRTAVRKTAIKRLSDGDCDACVIDLPLAQATSLVGEARQRRIPTLSLLTIVDKAEQWLEAFRAGWTGCLLRENLTTQSLERELHLLTNRIGAVCVIQAPLQKSEERYRRMADDACEAIYRISLSGYFTFVNPTAAAKVQRKVEECTNLHFSSLIREDSVAQASKFYLEHSRPM